MNRSMAVGRVGAVGLGRATSSKRGPRNMQRAVPVGIVYSATVTALIAAVGAGWVLAVALQALQVVGIGGR